MKKTGIVLLALSILLAGLSYVSGGVRAAVDKEPALVAPTEKVWTTKKSYMELQDTQVLEFGEDRYLVYRILYHNEDLVAQEFKRYGIDVYTEAGVRLNPKLLDPDKPGRRIPPQTTYSYTYYTRVSQSTSIKKIKLQITEWDFRYNGFAKAIGGWETAPMSASTPFPGSRNIRESGSHVAMQMSSLTFHHQQEDTVYVAKWELFNQGTRPYEVPEYRYWLQSASGEWFELERKDTSKLVLKAREKRTIELIGSVPGEPVARYQLVVTQSPSGTDNQQRVPLYRFDLPDSQPMALAGDGTILVSSSAVIQTSLGLYRSIYPDEANIRNYTLATRLQVSNPGNHEVTLPNYSMLFEAEDGAQYMSEMVGLEDGKPLRPKSRRNAEVRVIVPNTVDVQNGRWLLVEKISATGGEERLLPVMAYPMPTSRPLSAWQSMNTDKGDYSIAVNGYYRFPWLDEDELVADITVRNQDTQTLPIPELTASFYIHQKKVEGQVIQMDQIPMLAPGGEATVQVVGKIAERSTLENSLLILEEASDEPLKHRLNFNVSEPQPIPAAGDIYLIDHAGRSASLYLDNVIVYPGRSGDYVEIQAVHKNRENKVRKPNVWAGYLTSDNTVYPLELMEVSDKIGPDSRAVLSFWGKLPRGAKLADYAVVIGQALDGEGFSDSGNPQAILQPKRFEMPREYATQSNAFYTIPFKGRLDAFQATLSPSQGLTVSFFAELTQTMDAEYYDADHRIAVEVIDANGSVVGSQEYSLADGDSVSALKPGGHNYQFKTFQSNNVNQAIYEVKVYLKYKGEKKLMKSQYVVAVKVEDNVEREEIGAGGEA